jgi:hypothetical protein
VLVAAALAAACQPVDEVDDLGPQVEGEDDVAGDPVGAPETGMPATVGELRARTDEAARQWQEDPRVAEARVELDDEGGWREARVTYLAPEADRFLIVRVSPEGISEERLVLTHLDLTALPAEAVDEVPELPEDVAEPSALAEAAVEPLDECGVGGEARAVLYSSGAPYAWDPGSVAWSEPPAWGVTVTTDEGGGASLDPVTGEPAGPSACFEPAG